MVRIQLDKPKTQPIVSTRSMADKYAIRCGIITAMVMVVFNLLSILGGFNSFEATHLFLFFILFVMIGFGLSINRKWIRDDHADDDRMLFSIVMSVATAIALFAFNSILGLVNTHWITSQINLPIETGANFFLDAMAMFWSCLIMGFISATIFINLYKKR